jgi:hypothetical protein
MLDKVWGEFVIDTVAIDDTKTTSETAFDREGREWRGRSRDVNTTQLPVLEVV